MWNRKRVLIGMLHTGPLPAAPGWPGRGLSPLVERAAEEARIYAEHGYDALILENMHDRPYLNGTVGPETVAAMAVIAREVRCVASLPLGIQILAGANREALAVALAVGAEFIRAEGFIFGHMADEGPIHACAGDLLRYRSQIGADQIRVLVDIKKKHAAHAVTADVDLVETARAAEFFLADAVIVTGSATGLQASPDEVDAVAGGCGLPVLVGSGVTPDNLPFFRSAWGLIVGSYVKQNGDWRGPLDCERVARLAEAFRQL